MKKRGPGTLEARENIAAAMIELNEDDVYEIESATSGITTQEARYSEGAQRLINR